MKGEARQKVEARHLKRNAYLYVRQSTLRQVMENSESTKRQYDLRQRAIALGWPMGRIVVIDSDLGQSGASAADREGFQRLVAEVGMGHAGIVMGLEVSRLARNSTDWHRLLEICALSDTLILDEDGIYDPAHFNDRLLLGLQGTMSEAELHVLRARLRGGILNKARRAELACPLPIGFVYDERDRVVLDPDKQVQQALRVLFRTFKRTGSATATVKAFREQSLEFPRRHREGGGGSQIIWGPLGHSRALWILHNPRYAGAYFFGRTRQRRAADGVPTNRFAKLPRDEWVALVPGAHVGYITWDEFEENQRRLRENSAVLGAERRAGPAREGPALLQGLVVCGVCGDRMTVRYHLVKGESRPDYICQRRGIEEARPSCQRIPGGGIDRAVGELLIEAVTPVALDVVLSVQQELQSRVVEADALRAQQVERTRYEAELARRRFMRVDPENRLVADALEAEWNEKLRALTEAQEERDRRKQCDAATLTEEQRARVLALATDLPKLWRDPSTPGRERKRVVRLLLEDVTLKRGDAIEAHVRFKGGATKSLSLPLPLSAWQMRKTSPEVVAEIDRLLDQHTDAEIAALLNERGLRSGEGRVAHRLIVRRIRLAYGLKSRYDRLRAAGKLTLEEMMKKLKVSKATVNAWRRCGLLQAHRHDDKGGHLYDPPGRDAPKKQQGRPRLALRAVTAAVESGAV
ncbi:MAG: recombinase family protein [Planctomycetes bacterium]|nr:recombinase family protein [Planctomycetota bacterium]